jgi:nitrite reductase/ring-hydroxylating ferredoxin subunit/Fe-S cluster biogenesis protein NfuA
LGIKKDFAIANSQSPINSYQLPINHSQFIMTIAKAAPTIPEQSTLEELVTEIGRFEAIIAEWDESQRCVVVGLKRAIEDLHKEALARLIRSVKQESIAALRHAVEDEVVYGLLRYHELVKPPLEQRLQLALEEVRPSLKNHEGDVELVAIKPPDTVEIRLIGTCSHCPASTLTLSEGVERVIKSHCPEITHVIAVNNSPSHNDDDLDLTSPFARLKEYKWVEIATVKQIPEWGVLAAKVEGNSVILWRKGDRVFCYHNACTHLAYPIDMEQVNSGIITCPFHRFQYKLETGECLTAPELPLESYPVRIEGEKVFVQGEK